MRFACMALAGLIGAATAQAQGNEPHEKVEAALKGTKSKVLQEKL
jgi:hypothetical protein